jgi:hypothetical protein
VEGAFAARMGQRFQQQESASTEVDTAPGLEDVADEIAAEGAASFPEASDSCVSHSVEERNSAALASAVASAAVQRMAGTVPRTVERTGALGAAACCVLLSVAEWNECASENNLTRTVVICALQRTVSQSGQAVCERGRECAREVMSHTEWISSCMTANKRYDS